MNKHSVAAYGVVTQTHALVPLRIGAEMVHLDSLWEFCVGGEARELRVDQVIELIQNQLRQPNFTGNLQYNAVGNVIELAARVAATANVGVSVEAAPSRQLADITLISSYATAMYYTSAQKPLFGSTSYPATYLPIVVSGLSRPCQDNAVIAGPIVWVSWCGENEQPAKISGVRVEELRQRCLAILAQAQRNLAPSTKESMQRQIENLLRPGEWDDSEVVPLATSFGHAVAFLAKNNELRAPSITIANENFVFSYLRNRDRKNAVHLEFDGVGWVTCIVSLSPVGYDRNRRQAVMTVPVDEVRSHLELMGVWDWLVA
jgi:hypothetical protein